jgi:hypothetical protein
MRDGLRDFLHFFFVQVLDQCGAGLFAERGQKSRCFLQAR